MLTLRRHSISLTERDKDLFLHFHLDTQEVVFQFDYFFISFKDLLEKPWIGEVDRDQKSFKLIRSRAGIFKLALSRIAIKGAVINESGHAQLIVKYGLPVFFTIGVLMAITIFTLFTLSFLEDIWAWVIAFSILTLDILFVLVDLNRTADKLRNYIDRVRSNAPQQNV